MTETVRLLKGIMRTSGWTQEQLAANLGVSFPALNAWINGRAQPRPSMMKRIRRLYLAQDITKDKIPTYVTLVNVSELKVGDTVLLTKDDENERDDEAIAASVLELSEQVTVEDGGEEWTEEESEDGEADEELLGIRIDPEYVALDMYVANSVNTVVRGTSSAGRIYDRFEKSARAQVLFVFHRMAIARIVEWDYEV